MRGVNGSAIPPAGTVSRWPLSARVRASVAVPRWVARRLGRSGGPMIAISNPLRRRRFARCSTAGRSPGAPGSRSGLTVFSATNSRVNSTTSLMVVCMVLPQMAWQADLADALVDAGVEVATWVPDKRLAPIGERLTARGVPLRTLTREEECFGYAAGYRAAGGMPLVLLQCSGLGNSLNALGSLVVPYGLGFPAVLSMRGTLGERNPSQMPLGRATAGVLELFGVQPFPLAREEDVTAVARGAVATAEGARVLAPIVLESILDLR